MSLLSYLYNWKSPVVGHANMGKRIRDKKQKLVFLKGSLRAILAWPVICLLIGTSLWVLTLSRLNDGKAALNESAFKQASALSEAYAQQLSRSIEQLDQITLNLKYYWQKTHGGLDLEDQLQQGLYPTSALVYVSIFDRNGALVTSTFNKKIPLNLSDAEWFQSHRTGVSKGLLIVQPEISPRIGKMIIRFTRGLKAADGSFDGVISVAVEPPYLASFTDESSLGNSGFLSVGRKDGVLFATKMGESIRSLTTTVFRSPPAFESDKGVAAIAKEKFVDKQSRIVAWESLKNYPLVSTVGLSEDEIFASYEAMSRDLRNFAIAGSVFLLLVAIVGIYFSSRLAWRKEQANEVKNTYRLATDGAREGFYMVRALYDADNHIVDFLVEDCNERGAVYYGTTRNQLIGVKFADFSSSDYLEEVLAIFRRAMQSGFYEDEFKVVPDSPLRVTWVHRRLVRSGNGIAVTLRDISEMKAHEEALSQLANADAVTALPNRHWLMNFLPTAVARAKSESTVLALLFVDLDDFKNINDTLGHSTGDELLQAVAFRLKSVIRPQDNVARLGGDEFTIILERVDSDNDVSRVAERIIQSLNEPFVLAAGDSHIVHGSIGISMFPRDGDNEQTLLKHADIAMYAAKENGKGDYEFYQPYLSEKLVVRLNKEEALRRAIERDEFVLYYQPRVDTFTGELRSMEALVRWIHPEHGLVSPVEFISMAEDTGLIMTLGELVIEKACAQLAQWKAQYLPVVPVSINVSPRQFNHGNISTFLAFCMAHHDIDPSLIEVEITESCMIGEDNAVTEELAAIEALGIKLLVDDFGTGYSSLSQLQRLDLDILKIDRAFTAQLCTGKEGEKFFMAILSMAHVLGMSVVAEGVETVEQLRVLQTLSCNEVQGYFISRPVPANEIPPLMQKRFLFPHLRPSLQVV
jgi:diguanylate cyclase (GGDEF)-like protein